MNEGRRDSVGRRDSMGQLRESRHSPKQESAQMLQRLIDWNVDVLLKLLKQVVAKREALGTAGWDEDPILDFAETVAEEVVEVMELPAFDKKLGKYPKSIDVDPQVAQQLRLFVTAIASAYHSNAYHCLQHASHVTMSITKLISRIAISDIESQNQINNNAENGGDTNVSQVLAAHLHNHTYGIGSDPLAQFSIVLSALIHAVDHRGISNKQLAKEEPELAKKYKGKSITEQLSVDKAWKKLMEPEFENLRRCIYADGTEKKRFRQIMVNSVLSTDIDDEEAQARRQARWDRSFGPGAGIDEDLNSKATCVIESLMQAADAAHTMQHWHVYVKWNERGFEEATKAYKDGRIPTDPAKTWYKDELSHFDNFVIPLAMQLKDIDAFVVCSDEYLTYALKNRQRWASNGRHIVAALVAKYTTGSASATSDLIKAISKEGGRNIDDKTRDAAALKHLQRLVDWNVEVLERLLKQIVAKRQASGMMDQEELPTLQLEGGENPVDEVAEVINFPAFDESSSPDKLKPLSVQLSDPAASQLREFVSYIASQFRDNAYHCLDHGSQVSMAAKKLLGRLVLNSSGATPAEAHKKTLGLGSDPVVQFAIVFASLIHDIDHNGVPNHQLIVEGNDFAKKYKSRSIAEQHSIDLVWNQLMQPEFEDFIATICGNEIELKRFRQIFINAVLATDYKDPQLTSLRKKRWERLSSSSKKSKEGKAEKEDNNDVIDLKATIAVVVLIQAADAFHALQHWQMYQKWTERHFFELYDAYESGRLKQDPSEHWFKNELRFLEEHVIPLCHQMKELNVFGVSADECLAFATSNRDQWASKGVDIVKSMLNKYHGIADEKSRADTFAQRQSLTAA